MFGEVAIYYATVVWNCSGCFIAVAKRHHADVIIGFIGVIQSIKAPLYPVGVEKP